MASCLPLFSLSYASCFCHSSFRFAGFLSLIFVSYISRMFAPYPASKLCLMFSLLVALRNPWICFPLALRHACRFYPFFLFMFVPFPPFISFSFPFNFSLPSIALPMLYRSALQGCPNTANSLLSRSDEKDHPFPYSSLLIASSLLNLISPNHPIIH